eukprot:587311-Pyramimonas_sp.AAC.1
MQRRRREPTRGPVPPLPLASNATSLLVLGLAVVAGYGRGAVEASRAGGVARPDAVEERTEGLHGDIAPRAPLRVQLAVLPHHLALFHAISRLHVSPRRTVRDSYASKVLR